MISLSKTDIKRLQWSLALFVVLSALGAFIVTISTTAVNDANKAHREALAAKEDVKSKLARVRDEEQELRAKIAAYHTLVAHGVIGQEHRLEWIERIRQIKQARKLIDVRYEIGPQQPINAEVVPASVSGFDILASPIKLDMQLLHENDLLDFLSDLRTRAKGFVRIRHCDVARAANATATHGPAAQLIANCELGWITIREKQ